MQRKWSELAERYEDLASDLELLRSLASLCRRLSVYESKVFGYTSMHTLVLTQQEHVYPIHSTVPQLRVEPDQAKGIFAIEFGPLGDKRNRSREIGPDGLGPIVENWLRDLNWI